MELNDSISNLCCFCLHEGHIDIKDYIVLKYSPLLIKDDSNSQFLTIMDLMAGFNNSQVRQLRLYIR